MSLLDSFAYAANNASDDDSPSPVALSDCPRVAQRQPRPDSFAQSVDLADSDQFPAILISWQLDVAIFYVYLLFALSAFSFTEAAAKED